MTVVKAAGRPADLVGMRTLGVKSRPCGRPRAAGRRGVVVVYFLIMWTALIAFVALTVDYGRVQLDKQQLQFAADAAARAGLSNLSAGVSSAQSAAVNVAAANRVDGSGVIVVPSTDFAVGYWDPVARTFTAAVTPAAQSTANACQVTGRRTAATGNPVPLLMAGIFGQTGCDIRSTAVTCRATNVPLVNVDFELPLLGTDDYTYDASMPGWTLTGSAALATYGSHWHMTQPHGNQAIALQGQPTMPLATIAQPFSAVAGTYTVSLLAAQRGTYTGYTGSTEVQPVSVTIDSAQIGLIQPTSTTFATYTTVSFTLATGGHTLTLAATDGTVDHTTFVDEIAINVSGATPVLLAN